MNEQSGKKRYQMKHTCPQCGCSGATALSREEMLERYGDVPNIEVECSECMAKYTKEMNEVCPEWSKECRENPPDA